eukprot:scaffold39136_cov63-Phaeocystis_antarctica.AAC.3
MATARRRAASTQLRLRQWLRQLLQGEERGNCRGEMTITPPQPCRETAEELGCAEVRRLLGLLLALLLTLLLALLLTLLLTRRATEALLVLDDAALWLLPQDQ